MMEQAATINLDVDLGIELHQREGNVEEEGKHGRRKPLVFYEYNHGH